MGGILIPPGPKRSGGRPPRGTPSGPTGNAIGIIMGAPTPTQFTGGGDGERPAEEGVRGHRPAARIKEKGRA